MGGERSVIAMTYRQPNALILAVAPVAVHSSRANIIFPSFVGLSVLFFYRRKSRKCYPVA